MKKIPLKKIEQTAITAALASGDILVDFFRKTLTVREKINAGIVSNADLASEETCIRILKSQLPGWGFLAEESGTAESTPGVTPGRWIIDPLDGTTNFVHGFPMFCVSIGAQWNGQLVAGVVYHPILKDLYVAVRGHGARVNKTRIHVSQTRKITQSLLATGFAYSQGKKLHQEIVAFERVSQLARAVRRAGSAALDLAYTARGIFDGFWERGLAPWDTAAGALLVEEAGGRVSNFDGQAFELDHPEILASNAPLHGVLQKAIARGLNSQR